ncbi:MAG TPA: transcription initiation factor IIB [Nitrososphaera sp.]|jgi:transcription initiation factor TFIIB|nr:transcription initiation factor IIB [Nitrososphaera sp.]
MLAGQQETTGIDAVIMCNTCSGNIICDPDTGEEVCSSCGTVTRDNIEVATERRAFTFEEMDKRYRTGEPASLMMYDMGLSSFIDNKNIDANGKQIHGYSEIDRLRRLNKITVSNNSKTKNLNKAMREIRRITEILGIGNPVAERAAYIYRKALDKGLIKGRSITGIVAATVYIACKDAGTPRSIDEIQEVIGNADRKNIAYYYKFLLREMKIRVPLPVPSNSISRIAGKARLSEKTARKALELLSAVVDNAMLSGKNPVSLAAAALYLATIETKEYTTQLRIAIAADVSTVTVRKRCLEIIQLVKRTNPGLLTSLENSDRLLSAIRDTEAARIPVQELVPKINRGLFLSCNETGALSDLPV